MSTATIYICDRCCKEHRGAKPFGWQTGVEISMGADGLPNYSPYYIRTKMEHMCEDCAIEVSNAINAGINKAPKP